MTFLGPQFLYVADPLGSPTELINGARTTRLMSLCTPFSNPLWNAGCDVLTLNPCTTTSDGTTITKTAWSAVNFAATSSPWYRASVPASSEALGFIIEEWTGLDGSHRSRSVAPVGSFRGGGVPGPLSSRHRVMKLNVLLHGTTERSLQYLFGWLEQRLMDCCNPCGGRSIWYREHCPALGAPEEGLRKLNDVVLLDGPTWEAPPTEASGCYLRRVSFTLAAGDPCSYSNDTDVTSATALISGVALTATASVAGRSHWVGTSRRVTATLPAPQVGRVAPIVTITSPREVRTSGVVKPLPDLRIVGHVNPTGGAFDPATSPVVGELIVSGSLSSGLVIEVDLAARSIRYREPHGANEWYEGSRLLGPQVGGHRRWWSSDNCYPTTVIVEPVHTGLRCSFDAAADPVSTWTVDINAVEFHGCC